MRKSLWLVLGAASGLGLAAAVWAHAVSLAGVDPQSIFHRLWMFQVVLFVVLAPLATRAVQRGIKQDPLDLPKREWQVLGGLLVYYAIHFYVFMALAAEHLKASLTWQMYSAGWILLFMLSLFFYWTRITEPHAPVTEPRA